MPTNSPLIVHENIKSPIAEAFRTLRTNLQFSRAGAALQTVMVTSAGPCEGKSTVVANTAVALAQSGKQVIILDCDLRKPTQHQIFGQKKDQGLTNALVESVDPLSLIQETKIPNLRLVSSGPIPPNPSELLGSDRMREILALLKTQAEVLVIDTSPVVAVTDPCVLVSQVDGVVLVLDTTSVRPEMAQRAKELILKANGHFLGVVLNKVEISKEHSYYYYYYGHQQHGKNRGA